MSVTTYLHGAVGLAWGVCRDCDSCEEGGGREEDFGGGGWAWLEEGGSVGCDLGWVVEGWRLFASS